MPPDLEPDPASPPDVVEDLRSAIVMLERQHQRLEALRRTDPTGTLTPGAVALLGATLAELAANTTILVRSYANAVGDRAPAAAELRAAIAALDEGAGTLVHLYGIDR